MPLSESGPPAAPRTRSILETGAFFTLLSLILVVILALGAIERAREVQAEQQVEESYATRASISNVFSLVQEAENSQRGYIITGDAALLKPYLAARSHIGAELARLDSFFYDDPDQRARFNILRGLTDARFTEMADAVAARDRKDITGAAGKISQHAAQGRMTRIRTVVQALTSAEALNLATQTRKAQAARVGGDGAMAVLLISLVAATVVAVLRDRRRLAEQARLLDQTEADATRLRALFDNAVDGIVTLNPSGSIESVNPAALKLFGYRAEDLLRRDVSRLLDVAQDSRDWFLRRLAQGGDLGEGFVRELSARRSDGSVFPVDVALGTMELPTGRHVVAIIRDISERRRIEGMKDEFVGTVSHELRTPLTSIAGSLGLLQGGAGGQLPPRAARLVEIAEANSRRLVRLINDILDMEKIGSKTTVFSRDAISLDRLALSALDAMGGLAAERKVMLRYEGPTTPLIISGDHDRLMQVLSNLLSNAIKFSSEDGEVVLCVEAAEGGMGRISVRDHGPGVPSAFHAKLFQKFAQADGSDSRSHGGTGLGLAIAKEIVERLDGTIGHRPAEGGGAVFHIDLPLIAVAVAEERERELRYLICEDDVLTAEVVRDDFERHGMIADVVETAAEARHALHTQAYAGLVLDIHLPDSNGLTLIRALRDAPATRDLPIVVVSGSRQEREDAARLGIIAWLDKPVDLTRLRHFMLRSGQDANAGKALILHVDDDRDMQEVARGLLGASGSVVFAESLATAREILGRRIPDLVIMDLGLPDGSGLDLLHEIKGLTGRSIPAILYTAQEPSTAMLPASVEAVLIKSRASLPELARAARAIILRDMANRETS